MTDEQVKAFWAAVADTEAGNVTVRCTPHEALAILRLAKICVRAPDVWIGHCAAFHPIIDGRRITLMRSLAEDAAGREVGLVCFARREALLEKVESWYPTVGQVLGKEKV